MIFWGLKTVALFDVWSIEHVLSGISAGASVQNHHDKKIQKLNPHPPRTPKFVFISISSRCFF